LAIGRDLITIQKDLRDEYQIRGQISGVKVEYSAQNLPGAFNLSDALVPKEFSGIVKRDARWHSDKPTDKQLQLCRILKIPVPTGASKGMVSAAITQKRMQMSR
jgi:hypothetical protein